MLLLAYVAAAQLIQQGGKLVGTGAVGPSTHQGFSVAISADGSTAIVGAWGDNSKLGAAWVYTRSGSVWTQQGDKLVGTGAVGAAYQGYSVGISGDGSTAIVGGLHDNSDVGAAWVFARSGGVWSQQGTKLVGAGGGGAGFQGTSVALSADGNTAIVGATNNSVFGTGAAWIFTRSGDVWSQQGGKLVGTGAAGYSWQGQSVAISADGNTAVVGGIGDNGYAGAAWVYTRSADVWTQQGSKLAGLDAVGAAWQGASVAISDDGNTVVVGGGKDNSNVGAAWVYTRSSGAWSQQGSKLVGTGAVGTAYQGGAVAVSGDGNTAIVGGLGDDSLAGATWVYTRSGGVWSQQGGKLVGMAAVGAASQGGSVAASADGSTVIVGGGKDNSDVGAAWIFSTPASNVWVPVASHNGGLNHSQWRSDLGILNAGTATANVEVKFYGNGGVVSNSTHVPAAAQSILVDVVGQIGGSGSGALQILSDQPLKVTARSYNQVSSTADCYPDGAQGQDYPALVSSDGLSAQQSAYLGGLTENATYRCNVGVVNTGVGSASVLVELFDGAGTKIGEYPLTLTPGQWSQATQPFLNVAGQTAMDRGYAKITVQTGSGVFGFASVISNITTDPTTIAMQR
jgi:hypothetical protein